MIKAAGRTGDGTPLLLLGVSGENVTRLAAGEPILIRSDEMKLLGMPAMQLIICYGRTEAAIMEELEKSGLAAGVRKVNEGDER